MTTFESSYEYAKRLIAQALDSFQRFSSGDEGSDVYIRRGISNCYYAIFHLTTVGGSCELFELNDLKLLASRAFEHGTIDAVYQKLNEKNINNDLHKLGMIFSESNPIAKDIISKQLRPIYEELLELRGKADYDFSSKAKADLFTQPEELLAKVKRALDYIDSLKTLKEDYPGDFKRLIALFLLRKISLPIKG